MKSQNCISNQNPKPIGFDATTYETLIGHHESTFKTAPLACGLQVQQDRQATLLEPRGPLVGVIVIAEDLEDDDRRGVDAPADGSQNVLAASAAHMSTHSHRRSENSCSASVWSATVVTELLS